jgi:DNA-directed RNA polymerase subunit RPC12/RpoP
VWWICIGQAALLGVLIVFVLMVFGQRVRPGDPIAATWPWPGIHLPAWASWMAIVLVAGLVVTGLATFATILVLDVPRMLRGQTRQKLAMADIDLALHNAAAVLAPPAEQLAGEPVNIRQALGRGATCFLRGVVRVAAGSRVLMVAASRVSASRARAWAPVVGRALAAGGRGVAKAAKAVANLRPRRKQQYNPLEIHARTATPTSNVQYVQRSAMSAAAALHAEDIRQTVADNLAAARRREQAVARQREPAAVAPTTTPPTDAPDVPAGVPRLGIVPAGDNLTTDSVDTSRPESGGQAVAPSPVEDRCEPPPTPSPQPQQPPAQPPAEPSTPAGSDLPDVPDDALPDFGLGVVGSLPIPDFSEVVEPSRGGKESISVDAPSPEDTTQTTEVEPDTETRERPAVESTIASADDIELLPPEDMPEEADDGDASPGDIELLPEESVDLGPPSWARTDWTKLSELQPDEQPADPSNDETEAVSEDTDRKEDRAIGEARQTSAEPPETGGESSEDIEPAPTTQPKPSQDHRLPDPRAARAFWRARAKQTPPDSCSPDSAAKPVPTEPEQSQSSTREEVTEAHAGHRPPDSVAEAHTKPAQAAAPTPPQSAPTNTEPDPDPSPRPVVQCPSCGRRKPSPGEGRYRCSQCSHVLVIGPDGRLVVSRCPECGKERPFPGAGKYRCAECRHIFELDAIGNVM